MAKDKKKSKEKVVEKDKVVKKDNKKKKCCCYKTLLIIASISTVLIAIASCKIYSEYTKLAAIPEMPEFDLNKWWGPNTTTEQDTSVRRFRVMFPDAMQEEIRKKFELYRLMTTRKKSLVNNWTYGFNTDALGQLLAHWLFKYEFKDSVKSLSRFDHFKTNIQGLDIHFVHVKPNVDKNVKVVPLMLLHGWPSSVREFYDAIPLLTTVRPGYDFVFEIIVPSLPGFAYSQAPTKPGLHPVQMALIMRNLMQRLGFKQYYVQGGDFGHTIASHIATIFPKEVLGFHTNLPSNFSKLGFQAHVLLKWLSSLINGEEEQKRPFKPLVEHYIEETGYMHLQGTKPDTLGIVLNECPVGLAAYIIEKFMVFTDPANKFLEDGGLSKYFTLPALMDNVMLYWFTGSITTSIRLYKETFDNHELEETLARIPTPVPTWGLQLKHEIVHYPECILRWKYPALVGTTNLDFGGHYAAFEIPKEFADDVFLAVSKFMEFNKDRK